MANKPIKTDKFTQILSCHAEGRDSKHIRAVTGMSRNTVQQYSLSCQIITSDYAAKRGGQLK